MCLLEKFKQLINSNIGAYFLIGAFASTIDTGVFSVIHELTGLNVLIAHSISVPLAAITSFTLNLRYNFKKSDNVFYRLLSFLLIVILGYLLGGAIIAYSNFYLSINGSISKIISLPFVALLQYYLNSRISFR